VFLEAHSWSEEQHIGRCLESAVRSPCNFSGSVLPLGYLIACLIPTMRESRARSTQRACEEGVILIVSPTPEHAGSLSQARVWHTNERLVQACWLGGKCRREVCHLICDEDHLPTMLWIDHPSNVVSVKYRLASQLCSHIVLHPRTWHKVCVYLYEGPPCVRATRMLAGF